MRIENRMRKESKGIGASIRESRCHNAMEMHYEKKKILSTDIQILALAEWGVNKK